MIAAIAPPADIPATYTLPSATSYSSTSCLVMPAMSDGSPRPRCWSAAWNQFQHLCMLALPACSGYATRKVCFSESSFIRVPVAKSSGLWVQHDDQGHGLPGVAAGDVKFVGASPGAVGVRTLDEASYLGDVDGGEFFSLRTGRVLHAA